MTAHLRYGEELYSIFDMLAKRADIDECDKVEFTAMTLTAMGVSLEHLDRQIVIGVENGYPAEKQMALIAEMLNPVEPT